MIKVYYVSWKAPLIQNEFFYACMYIHFDVMRLKCRNNLFLSSPLHYLWLILFPHDIILICTNNKLLSWQNVNDLNTFVYISKLKRPFLSLSDICLQIDIHNHHESLKVKTEPIFLHSSINKCICVMISKCVSIGRIMMCRKGNEDHLSWSKRVQLKPYLDLYLFSQKPYFFKCYYIWFRLLRYIWHTLILSKFVMKFKNTPFVSFSLEEKLCWIVTGR